MMKARLRLFAALLGVAFAAGAAWSNVNIDAQNFPDANFRKWLKDNVAEGGDVLEDYQIPLAYEMQLDSSGISSLEGLEHFTALEWLHASGNSLTEVTLPGGELLKFVELNENKLTRIDTSRAQYLYLLQCHSNALTRLDTSRNPKLETLVCYENKLKELDVSHNPNLGALICRFNELTKLDVSHNSELGYLDCSYNKLKELDLSHNPDLEKLFCEGNDFKKLDLSHNQALKSLYCSLEELDLSKNPNLSEVELKRTSKVTLPNGDRLDFGGIVRLPKKEGGDYRLDLSKYGGKIDNVIANNLDDYSETPLSAGTFKPFNGYLVMDYRLGEDGRKLHIRVMGLTSAPGFESSGGDSKGDDAEPYEKPSNEVHKLSVKLVNKTDANIFVALAGWPEGGEDAGSFTRGWYKVEPARERTVTYSNVNLSYGFGFYAKSGKRLVWTAKPGDSRYAGSFWIHPQNAFKSNNGKPVKGGKQVNFRTFAVSEDGKATIRFSVKK